jgi:hypothetical protein
MRRAAWFLIVAAMTALGPAARAAPVPIRIGWAVVPANHDAAVALVASFTKRPPTLYQSWAFTATGDDYRPPDGIPDIAVVNRSIALQHEYGYLKARLAKR